MYVAAWFTLTATDGIVTGTETYQRIERQVVSTRGPRVAKGLHWIVEAETRAWPVNEGLRRTLLLGLDFGYRG